ncbi:V-type ATP synthase subunit E [Thermogladius calderae]|nr:V-type ATP synthase subunit E [Thermogladius calderae]
MSVEELKRVVLEKAKAEADEIIREAIKKSEAIVKDAEERRKRFIESEKAKIRSELQVESRIGEARRRARLIVSSAKAEVARAIEEKAITLLRSLGGARREESLKILLEESLSELGGGARPQSPLEVYVSPVDRAAVERLLKERGLDYQVHEDPSIMGGVRISCCGGEVVVDNTYNTRLKRVLTALQKEVSRDLPI